MYHIMWQREIKVVDGMNIVSQSISKLGASPGPSGLPQGSNRVL